MGRLPDRHFGDVQPVVSFGGPRILGGLAAQSGPTIGLVGASGLRDLQIHTLGNGRTRRWKGTVPSSVDRERVFDERDR